MQALPQEPVLTSPGSSFLWYLKWFIIIVVLGYLVYILQPYFSMFLKIVELIRTFLKKAFQVEDIEPDAGAKLVENKQEKDMAKAGYCYMGDKDNLRQCARVDKSSCSGNFYSTESQCVNPS
jgi:hypothetical protein